MRGNVHVEGARPCRERWGHIHVEASPAPLKGVVPPTPLPGQL